MFPSPRSTKAASGAASVSSPSFVVTAGTDASTRPPSAKSLNPEAREFHVSPSFGGSVFAMPAVAGTPTHARWTPSPRHEASGSSPHSASPLPPQSSASGTGGTSRAAFDAADSDSVRLIEMTEAYMHTLYDARCREEGLHLVSVFHLHPRTTNKQLCSIFFPTGANAAEVIDTRSMPETLANAFTLVRQRAGVVFFSRKEFAMVGVEKVHDFVPHGQHQPLVVRYCGPEKRTSPKPSSPPTTRPVPLPLSAQQSRQHQQHHSTVSAPSQPVLGMDQLSGAMGNTYDAIDQHFLQKYAGERVFLVGVHNLAHGTTTKSFFKMFYPMGALNSELLPRPVSVDGKLRCSGVAVFDSRGMAIEAAEKMNDFVPHGQRRPVVARFLEPAATTQDSAEAAVTTALPPTASTPRSSAVDAMHAVPSSAVALLCSIDQQLHARTVSDEQLAADVCALVLCQESSAAEAQRLAELLRDTLRSMGDHSTIMSSPLSGALRTAHTTLGIRPRNSSSSMSGGDAEMTAAARKGVLFFQPLGRMLMMLVADTAAPRQARLVAAVQCAYLYQYNYLPKTPLAFATALFEKCSQELCEARAFLCRAVEVPSSLAEERQHRPWITLMDALHEMVQVWKTLGPSLYAQDPCAETYERFVRDFRGGEMVDTTGRSPHTIQPEARSTTTDVGTDGQRQQQQFSDGISSGAQGQNGACTPRTDALELSGDGSGNGASSSAKKSQLVTPSARPTPRRVVSKSYSTTEEWRGKQQGTPAAATTASAVPPQVVLASPASDYTQGASEASVGSGSALRSNGVTPQHPSMRFAWGANAVAQAPVTMVAPPSLIPPPAQAQAQSAPNGMSTVMPVTTMAPSLPGVPPLSGSTLAPLSSGTSVTGERNDVYLANCTVYITKLPSGFTAGQVRQLLLHFGEFRKVRLCHDEKETTRGGTAAESAAHLSRFQHLCFGFVEFVDPSGARAMVEFFRNSVHSPVAFNFLRATPGKPFEDADLQLLRSTRTSQARNPIHDQQPVDASSMQPCLFGLVKPEHPVETYADAVTVEEAVEAARVLGLYQPQQQVPVQMQMQMPPPVLPLPGQIATAPMRMPPDAFSPFAFPGEAAPTTVRVGGILQPMAEVHFPRHFPFQSVFPGATQAPRGEEAVLSGNNSSSQNNNNFTAPAPVMVEDDDEDDDYDGLEDSQVQQILELLS